MQLTPLGREFESVIAATILFLAGGVVSFICCFCVTQSYLWHKRRLIRRRLRHEWSEDTESTSADVQGYQAQVQREPQRPPTKTGAKLERAVDEKRPIMEKTRSQEGWTQPGGAKKPQNAVIFECGSSGTEETNSS